MGTAIYHALPSCMLWVCRRASHLATDEDPGDTSNLSGATFTSTSHAKSYAYIAPAQLDLSGKKVLITGAAWEDGIGFATATAFIRAGVSALALADIEGVSANLIARLKKLAVEARGCEPLITGHAVDITSPTSVEALRDAVSNSFEGRLDILVNNAAHMEPNLNFLDSDPEVLWRTWEVNIRGLLNMVRAFLPMQLASYKEQGALCTIINVSSSGALTARPGSSSYRSSKLAILRWTESLHLEYESQGLLAYCVNPGAITTQLSKNSPEHVWRNLPHRPDIAGDTIVWLASERRQWLGGRYISCPWDMEEFQAKSDEIVREDKLKLRMLF